MKKQKKNLTKKSVDQIKKRLKKRRKLLNFCSPMVKPKKKKKMREKSQNVCLNQELFWEANWFRKSKCQQQLFLMERKKNTMGLSSSLLLANLFFLFLPVGYIYFPKTKDWGVLCVSFSFFFFVHGK